ncbi:hypothetical protein L2E82_11022 [Cichorium intybus]|uniref:Uncharacterized protein n=1 Tax=Cichorium intybus TaxID=13427 RepID=A0ACB9GD83_CICIN|nr:hypothetical protein L2E82_11022 [Cichorium intybus]
MNEYITLMDSLNLGTGKKLKIMELLKMEPIKEKTMSHSSGYKELMVKPYRFELCRGEYDDAAAVRC